MDSGIPASIKVTNACMSSSLAVAVQTLSHVTDIRLSISKVDEADVMTRSSTDGRVTEGVRVC